MGLRKLSPAHCLPPGLSTLLVSDNSLGGSQLESLTHLTGLRHLDIAGNRFSKFEQLGCLSNLRSLARLDAEGCPVAEMPDYRATVFELLGGLPDFSALDGIDKAGKGER